MATVEETRQYLDYTAKYNKSYSTVNDMESRRKRFTENDRYIKSYDAASKGQKLQHNKFSDWTPAQLSSILISLAPS